MEFESLVERNAREATEKMFGDKDPELRVIVQTELSIDTEDPEDIAKREKMLKKMKREHERDAELLKEKSFLIHDKDGNLVPYNLSG